MALVLQLFPAPERRKGQGNLSDPTRSNAKEPSDQLRLTGDQLTPYPN